MSRHPVHGIVQQSNNNNTVVQALKEKKKNRKNRPMEHNRDNRKKSTYLESTGYQQRSQEHRFGKG